jgi:ArsR family transcriptional regulator, lead/cadmium/zinc/bismuth-responsive transcriptional repressor
MDVRLLRVADDRCDLLCLDLPRAETLRRGRLSAHAAEHAAARAQALADPTRLLLAMALRDDELCVCDLAWVMERSDKIVSHHLRALRSAGLASARRDGKMVMYSLTEEGAALLAATLAQVEAQA